MSLSGISSFTTFSKSLLLNIKDQKCYQNYLFCVWNIYQYFNKFSVLSWHVYVFNCLFVPSLLWWSRYLKINDPMTITFGGKFVFHVLTFALSSLRGTPIENSIYSAIFLKSFKRYTVGASPSSDSLNNNGRSIQPI